MWVRWGQTWCDCVRRLLLRLKGEGELALGRLRQTDTVALSQLLERVHRAIQKVLERGIVEPGGQRLHREKRTHRLAELGQLFLLGMRRLDVLIVGRGRLALDQVVPLGVLGRQLFTSPFRGGKIVEQVEHPEAQQAHGDGDADNERKIALDPGHIRA